YSSKQDIMSNLEGLNRKDFDSVTSSARGQRMARDQIVAAFGSDSDKGAAALALFDKKMAFANGLRNADINTPEGQETLRTGLLGTRNMGQAEFAELAKARVLDHGQKLDEQIKAKPELEKTLSPQDKADLDAYRAAQPKLEEAKKLQLEINKGRQIEQ